MAAHHRLTKGACNFALTISSDNSIMPEIRRLLCLVRTVGSVFAALKDPPAGRSWFYVGGQQVGLQHHKTGAFYARGESNRHLDFTLSPSAAQQSVTVEATGAAVESSTSELREVVQ